MWIFIWVCITRIIFSLRLWVAETLFGNQESSTKILLFIWWIMIALRLLLFPTLLSSIWIQTDFFWLHTSVVVASIIWYTILAAHEEILKFLWSYLLYLRKHLVTNDLILYSIFIALGFSFGENIIYLIRETQTISDASNLAISRWLTWFLWHALFTGTIWYVASRWTWKKQVLSIIAWLCLGILLHTAYNLTLHYGFFIWFVVYIMLGYLFLTYLFFSSDRVYLD